MKVVDQHSDARLLGASISSLLQHIMDTFSRIVSRGVYHDLNDIDRAEPIRFQKRAGNIHDTDIEFTSPYNQVFAVSSTQL